MVMQPPNACETCGGTHWIAVRVVDGKVVEEPCPACNHLGMRPKIQY